MRKLVFSLVMIGGLLLAACGSAAPTAPAEIDINALPASIDVATAQALSGRDDVVVLDVREQWEYDEGHIPGVTLIPMGEITSRLAEIPTDKEVIVTCRSGNRSSQVTEFLRQQGFDNVHNMEGGILAWQSAGYAVEQ